VQQIKTTWSVPPSFV